MNPRENSYGDITLFTGRRIGGRNVDDINKQNQTKLGYESVYLGNGHLHIVHPFGHLGIPVVQQGKQ